MTTSPGRLYNRLMPDSLAKRISFTLLISIILLFLVNIGVVCVIQVRFLGLLEKERSDNVASFYVLLSDMDELQRIEALDRIGDFKRSTESSLSLISFMRLPPGRKPGPAKWRKRSRPFPPCETS